MLLLLRLLVLAVGVVIPFNLLETTELYLGISLNPRGLCRVLRLTIPAAGWLHHNDISASQ
jgi:hypothetical protein